MDRYADVDQFYAVRAGAGSIGPGSLNQGWQEKTERWQGVKGSLIQPVRQLLVGSVGVHEMRAAPLSNAQFAGAAAAVPPVPAVPVP